MWRTRYVRAAFFLAGSAAACLSVFSECAWAECFCACVLLPPFVFHVRIRVFVIVCARVCEYEYARMCACVFFAYDLP